jgi:hypothetical protein
VHPHWLLALHVQVAAVPHASVDPIGHVFVQKCVVGSPSDEHSFAATVLLQSERLAQNLPIPISLPVSPGLPQIELNASGAASGIDVPPPPPHAISNTTKKLVTLIARTIVQRSDRVNPRLRDVTSKFCDATPLYVLGVHGA